MGTLCVVGTLDTSFLPPDEFGNPVLRIVDNLNGMHCQCPMGLTGAVCDIPYESCIETDDVCYYGGTCVGGNDQGLVCDCSTAMSEDGTPRIGKYCEAPPTFSCGDDNVEFCVNGGVCNGYVPYTNKETIRRSTLSHMAFSSRWMDISHSRFHVKETTVSVPLTLRAAVANSEWGLLLPRQVTNVH